MSAQHIPNEAVMRCQRWVRGRAHYRPAGELFDPRHAGVGLIEEDAVAKRFIELHHYSHSYPAARLRVGLYEKRTFQPERLVGVAVFSVPMNQQVVPCYFEGLHPNEGVELGRFVLLDEVAANAETWFLARAFRLLRRAGAGVRAIVSYCDPLPRHDAEGRTVKPGHVGTIYKAHNGSYRGRATARVLTVARDGRVLSERAMAKIRAGDKGCEYAMKQLESMGAPGRLPHEPADAYLKRALMEGRFRRLKHPGNHVFTWRLD